MAEDNRTIAPSTISLRIDFVSEDEARNAADSLGVDDDDFVTTEVEGCSVIGYVRADSIEGARRAADDWLACLMAIVKKDRSGS
jgi:hypothetical protein